MLKNPNVCGVSFFHHEKFIAPKHGYIKYYKKAIGKLTRNIILLNSYTKNIILKK